MVFIIDVYSRRIVGYAASDHMRAEANLKALEQAFNLRKGSDLSKLIHHSDRGSQYISHLYTKRLIKRGVTISMGLAATDNAFAERVNGIIKNEYLNYWRIEGLNGLKNAVRKAVKHYNNKRIHRSLPNNNTPLTYENNLLNSRSKEKQNVLIHSMDYPLINQAFEQQSEYIEAPCCPIDYNNYLT